MSAAPRNDVVEAIALKNAGALGYLVAFYSGALVRAGGRLPAGVPAVLVIVRA